MNKIICSSLFLLAFISNLWADDCAACRTKKYKYVFCDPNQTTSPYKTLKFCSDNPYQTAQEKNLQVVKLEGPICFIYEKASFPYSDIVKREWQYDYIIPKSVDPTDGNFLVFYPYAMEEGQPEQITNPIHRARDSWNNICQIQQNDIQCCIKISWEKNLGYWQKIPGYDKNAPYIANSSHGWKNNGPSDGPPCEKKCENRKIFLNLSDEFLRIRTYPDGSQRATRLIYTNDPMPDTDPVTGYDYTDVEDYSMYSTLMHEMGHILGFFHSDGNDDDGNNCDHSGSIMKSSLTAGQDVPLTNDDICQFKILYCCFLENDVETDNLVNKFYSYPNPASDYIDINISSLILSKAKDPCIKIFDILGIEQFARAPALSLKGERVRIDISAFSPGVYFVRIGETVQKFIKY